MTFDEWVKYGFGQGWCGPPVCATHDGFPLSEAEYDDELDCCSHMIRLYGDVGQKAAIEAAHSPSIWRWSNTYE